MCLVYFDIQMYTFRFICLLYCILLCNYAETDSESDEPILYYYGLEESERSLPRCLPRQACSVLVHRYWRATALLRLCRCERRLRCDESAPGERTIDLNNRAHLQFCKSVTDWPECTLNEASLTVETTYDRMNPDELEELHHQNIQLTPPKINLKCRCPQPNYWKLSSEDSETNLTYRCTSLPLCKSSDFCGNVDYDLLSLYQSCLCPKNHICVHDGGIPKIRISELLYRGRGWRARCRPLTDDYGYEDY